MTPIQQIKAALPLSAYASQYLHIKANTALCPWHHEKTPSLKIYPTFFKCHGCGESGDLITFASKYHSITTSAAIRLLAAELNIPLTRQPAVHPYEAIKAQRLHDEAMEWRRLARLQMVNAPDYETSIPFLEDLDSMTRQQILAAYQEQRTTEQAAALRASIHDTDLWAKAFMPLAEKYIDYLAALSAIEFEAWTFAAWGGEQWSR
jgi:hypothetical protein